MENEDLSESETEDDEDYAPGRNLEIEADDDGEEIDDEDDDDYTPEEADDEDEGETEDNVEEPEVLEEVDKERSDKLWKDFLETPEKKEDKQKSDLKAVTSTKTKVYEFAGEKVNITPSPTSVSNGDKSWINKSSTSSSSGGRFGGQREVYSDKPYPSPRQDIFMTEGRSTVKRGGLSFLSGDPEQIGLAGPATKGGLSNVLAALQNSKRQKMGTLEKSRLDWEAFKKDAGIEDELQSQIRSKDGYLERQEFLQRSDMRAFEIEKNIRTKTRRHP